MKDYEHDIGVGLELDDSEEWNWCFSSDAKTWLGGFYHIDVSGREVDVREIDLGYALNLYNWYLKQFRFLDVEFLKETNIMKALKKRIGEIEW